jgi:hypothetical protein
VLAGHVPDEDIRYRGTPRLEDHALIGTVGRRRQRPIRLGGEIEELSAGGIEQDDVLPVRAESEEGFAEGPELIDRSVAQQRRGREQFEPPDPALEIALDQRRERVHGALVLRTHLIPLPAPELQEHDRGDRRDRHQAGEQQAEEVGADGGRSGKSHRAVSNCYKRRV